MKFSISSCQGITKVLRIITAASILTGLFSSYSTSATPEATTPPGTPNATKPKAAPPPPATEQLSPEEIKRRQDWNESIMQKPPPKKGCFTATYPNTEWQEVPCGPVRNIPMIPRHGPRPDIVGNNNDISAQAPSGHISQAIGHFENITNVTSESGPIGNTGPSIANAYTLQINTNFFGGTSVCAASPNPNCQGWEQFVYENNGNSGFAYIQYWIIAYNANCPAGQGWNQIALYGGTYCWKNNSAGSVGVPNQPITNIGNWTFSGQVSSTGDSVTMSTGTNVYTRTGDNAVDAANGWTTAEFNIFGDGGNSSGGGTASFNSGASVTARTQIIYGGTAAPTCVAQGFTAEMNNLSFGPTAPAATAPGPAVIFTESIAGGVASNCAAATTVGDTHLATFNGLFYDFQASGDFVLAQVDSDFVVQTRQVSGAPTWPDASVNNAVATRMGKTQVAICLAPAGREPARLNVNGKPTDLGDGKLLSLPDGVVVRQRGNVYVITSESGDSVRAEVNAGWINVTVGLGRWPVKVRGLIANANGNVNQIETRDGNVLTNPFSFEDLYHRYADSWRVASSESLLSVCGDKEVERSIPKRLFYASDLDPKLSERTRAVCTAAGVKAGPLLDACTLDVAVIGNDAATKVFVGAHAPIAVGIITPRASGPGFIVWLLLLIVIAVILWILIRKMRTTP